MADVEIPESSPKGYWPGLDYSSFPDDVYEYVCALCADDDGNIESVAPFLRPYVSDKVTPEGWLKRPDEIFHTPLSIARYMLAFDREAPVPWRGMGLRPSEIKEYIENAREEERAKEARQLAGFSDLYFIGGDDGPIKIGVSGNPEKRLKQIQTGHPYPLSLLVVVPNAGMQEMVYHERFAEFRLEGEWFSRHPDILAEIDRLRDSTPYAGDLGKPGHGNALGSSHKENLI